MFAVALDDQLYVSSIMSDFLASLIVNNRASVYAVTGLSQAKAMKEYYEQHGYSLPCQESLVQWAQRVIDTQNWRLP